MFKSKVKMITIAFMIFVISLIYANNNYAKIDNLENNEVANWSVVIASDTKDLKDTQEINFKVQDNPNVVKGKIAPGLKALASIEIDLRKTKVPVDIKATVDDSKLQECFKLTAKLDGKDYLLGSTETIELGDNKEFTEEKGKRVLTLEIEWVNDVNYNEIDTIIGNTVDSINLPITISIEQHI